MVVFGRKVMPQKPALFLSLLICCLCGFAQQPVTDTGDVKGAVLPYAIRDYRGDHLSASRSSFDLQPPSNFTDSVAYDPVTRTYTIYEKIGNKYYRTPTVYSFSEYWALRNRQAEQEYFQRRANIINVLNRGRVQPKLTLTDRMFNRLFGDGKVEIKPQGNVEILAGYMGQKIDNPTLPERARNNGGLDFDMNAQMNVNANIGNKLRFPINYNTLANFDMENQLKLDYTGSDDDIIKRFEAGNVNFPARTTLIPGAQQLFGIKSQLQFGKLYVTGVLANQKSQRQSMDFQGASASQYFELRGDEYEENRHFLLGQYFYKNFNKRMSTLPAVISPVQVMRMEVWVTNRMGITTQTRDVVGLMDLAETQPYLQPPVINVVTNQENPSNQSNDLLSNILARPGSRNPSLVYENLRSLGLSPVQDFEKTFARKLDSTQYQFNPKVGFLTLSQPLMPDEVLAVAYQYSYNGKIYQVGEFSQDVPPDTTTATQKVLYLKLLKGTSQRTNLPLWDLMLKNVYSVGFGTLSAQDFKLDVLYDEPGLGAKRYVPLGDRNLGTPLISLVNLDRLNNQNDPMPDGVFDFVEGYTVFSQYSRVMFPVLEPFGRDLATQIYNTVPGNVQDTLYYALYDSIKAVAQQYPNLNRFILKGRAQSSGSSEISIGFNVPPGSVTVTAGGRVLQEGIDYDINYDYGTIRITNPAVINSGMPVQVNYENNASFGLQQRSYMGLRLDYLAKNTAREQLSLGASAVRLSERPFFTKVNLNEDPIRNSMYGLDMNYRRETPRITKWLDKLPFYSTTAPSNMNVYAEAAMLKPGHAPQIGRGKGGVIYIDDFEGSKSGIDLRFPANAWALASTPVGAKNPITGEELFPEAMQNNNTDYGKNRAKLAWYQIEQALQQVNSANNPIKNPDLLSDPRTRMVFQREIFPQRSTQIGESQLVTFDLAFYPDQRGPYNFDAASLTNAGKLTRPSTRWGGLMRSLDQTDFETANIEFIEFWLQDPFIDHPLNPNASQSKGGRLYFNLGNVSEDVLKDGKRFYENGLPTPTVPANVENTTWGRVPRNPIQVTNAFSNDPEDRPFQDQGFDGMNDTAEAINSATFLSQVQSRLGGGTAYQEIASDPSADNFVNYRNDRFGTNDGILTRYKNWNSPQGNSPIDAGSQYMAAATLYPDAEDLNRDNTLNETEEYFQYSIELKPGSSSDMQIGVNHIVDKKTVPVTLANGQSRNETWYQFRIPIAGYNNKTGNINDFKSIRFMRMFLTGFEDSVVVRFGELQLARNLWRRFKYKVDSTGFFNPESDASLNVNGVNIEENDNRSPLPYRTPREIERQQVLGTNGINLLMNEQALSLKFCELGQKDAKAVFQTYANRDLRQFKKLSMFIHAEEDYMRPRNLKDRDLTAVVRIGSDFVSNYYEIRIPLYLTPLDAVKLNPDSPEYNDTLWIPRNSLDVDLITLTKLKQNRNTSGAPYNEIFRLLQENGHTYSVMGNPNLAEIRGILIGVENTANVNACGEMWVNELRLSSIDEKGGFAALARADIALADLGTLSVSANMHSNGFGSLEQRINERFRDDYLQFDAAANLEMGRLLPKTAAVSIPVFASYSKTVSTPEYDPYDMDIKYKDKLRDAGRAKRDSIKNNAIEMTTTKSVNFTNVRKIKTTEEPAKVYDITNFDISYSYLKTEMQSPLIEYNDVTRHRGVLGYNYAPQPRYFEPFKNKFKPRGSNNTTPSKWLDFLRDFNINYVPSELRFRADLSRQFGVIRPRSIGASKYAIPETYDKYFMFQRDYIARWNLTRSLIFDYTATNNSRIDEPYGRIDTKAEKDSVWRNLFRGGRNTLFNQNVRLDYTVPTNKFPLLDWTMVRLNYQASYRWIGASRLVPELGNFLENGQQKEATAQLDFTRLYEKSKWLSQLDKVNKPEDREKWRNRIQRVKDTIKLESGKEIIRTRKIVDRTAVPYVAGPLKYAGKLLTSLKQANFSFNENAQTRLPGYLDSTQFVGQNFRSMAPGFDFILGRQPDTAWLNQKARKNYFTRDSLFNEMIQQNLDQRYTLSATLEPFRDMNITVDLRKTFSKNYSETFRFIDTTGNNNPQWMHLTPYAGGSFDISYIAFKTLFRPHDPNRVSQTFQEFENNRIILSRRMANQNPYSKGQPQTPDGYYYGYNRYAVDVLIPSFVAAYTGKDPESIDLIHQQNNNLRSNPFRGFKPMPNWRLDFSGLTKINGLQKVFTTLNLTHAYNGSLSMNGFTSALLYQDVSMYGYPSFYDPNSFSFVPYFLVPNVTIQEQFAPLAGIDMQFTNQVQAKFDYSKSRMLSLSLIDYQLSETRSTEYAVGASWRKRGLKLLGGLKLPKFLNKEGGDKLDNDINLRLDLRMRDNVTSNSRLDEESSFSTGGSREISINPTVDYYLNQRVMFQLYFNQNRVKPYISTSAPITNTRAGVKVTVSLSQ